MESFFAYFLFKESEVSKKAGETKVIVPHFVPRCNMK